MVATAERDGRHVSAVVLGAESKDIRAEVAAKMLNLGFKKLGVNSDVPQNKYISAPTQNNPVARYAEKEYDSEPVSYNSGNVGVQFGAFSTIDAAKKQMTRVKNIIGLTPKIERNDTGLYRVRVVGLSESAATDAKNRAVANGIDCYIFH